MAVSSALSFRLARHRRARTFWRIASLPLVPPYRRCATLLLNGAQRHFVGFVSNAMDEQSGFRDLDGGALPHMRVWDIYHING
jgi:hypothetical protein